MPRFVRGGRGAWRKIQGSHHGCSNVGCGGAILVIFLFVADIILFVIACSVGYFPLIFIFGTIGIMFIAGIYQGIKETKEEKGNKDSIESQEQNKKFILTSDIKEKINYLTDKYFFAVQKYGIECHNVNEYGFDYILWRNTNWSLTKNNFYILEDNKELSTIIKEDWGSRKIAYNKYRGYYFPDTLSSLGGEEKLKYLIKFLKTELKENNEWENSDTIDFAIYYIIRNGLLRYFSNKYEEKYGYDTIEKLSYALFFSLEQDDQRCAKILYIYTYSSKHDIFAPLMALYNALTSKIETVVEKIKSEEYGKTLYFSQEEELSTKCDNISFSNEEDESQEEREYATLSPIERIDSMSGRQFEEFIAEFFKKKGYITSLTPESGDFGIDVIIENSFIKIGIQTKCYNDKVSNSAVQEAVTGIKHYNLDKAMVITNSYFQPSAITLAKDNNVILWDRDKLLQELEGNKYVGRILHQQ